MRTLVALLLAADPVALARVWPRRFEVPLYGGVVLAVAALVADPVLEVLDLSPEGFWIAAGLVLLVPGLGRLIAASTRDVAGPAAPLVAMALATRDGTGVTLLAVGVVLVVAWAVMATTSRPHRLLERVVGAGMIVVAFDLVRDGVVAV